ncbi:hypothetical protein WH87_15310 [Devosia epidermidihirudinis]|uniref:Uncharacterized protein n=1 Tax=Devosia epidermidihirudinis TaxID=1293439 RepID=A0A0F5Q4R4_9HYPH|nr:hypothetical protein [Devosia epidermidihirudinis]KKC35928.1 hypothetical protein WH87_15310 [Devosia epidermidihirudinis]
MSAELAAGIANVLDGCIGIVAGQSLLVVAEPEDQTFYRGALGRHVVDAAQARGLDAKLIIEPVPIGPEHFPAHVLEQIAASDHTLFFSRLGSQARFLKLPGPGTKTVSYVLDAESLAAPFGSLPYAFVAELHDLVVQRIGAARSYHLTCPNGSDLRMALEPADTGKPAELTPFAVRNFPVMIFPPISSARANGRLALTLALLSTSIHQYDDPIVPLDSPLLLDIADGKITQFGGEPVQAARAEAHFDRVAALFDADARALNSWHTGINPATFFAGRAIDDLGRWGSVAFGSPSYTHFHIVGSDPGEICGSLFNATIRFDDEILWDRGRFVFLERPEVADLLAKHGLARDALAIQQSIGVEA